MQKKNRLLVVSNADVDRWSQMGTQLLGSGGSVEKCCEQELRLLNTDLYDLIIIDAASVKSVRNTMAHFQQRRTRPKVVVANSELDEWELAREAFRAGAAAYVETADDLRKALSESGAAVEAEPAPAIGIVRGAWPPQRPQEACQSESRMEGCTMKGRILMADNYRPWVRANTKFLEKAGYRVFPAYSPEEARRVLQEQYIHLAILDIRLENDKPLDISGLVLAKEAQFSTIPKIILTRYPSVEATREALGPQMERLPPAVDFLQKKQGPEVMVEAVDRAFADFVRINRGLELHLSNGLSLLQLAGQFESGLGPAVLSERTEELEDLLRKLFHSERQLSLSRLLVNAPAQLLLAAVTFDEEGFEQHLVIACGQKARVQKEIAAFRTFHLGGTGGVASLIGTAETLHYAAAAYRLPESGLDNPISLQTFSERHPAEAINAVLDDLYRRTLAPLHQKDRAFRTHDLHTWLREWAARHELSLSPSLAGRIVALCGRISATGLAQVHYSVDRLSVVLPGEGELTYPNPLPRLFETRLLDAATVICSTHYGIIHGCVDFDRVLVGRRERAWLVDFSHTERGPLVEDFTSLEAAVRFGLLAESDCTVRYQMERVLLSASTLDAEVDTGAFGGEAKKALEVISHIRRCAAETVDQELQPYLVALLFQSAAYLASYQPEHLYARRELVPYLHALLLAAIIGEKVIPAPALPRNLPAQALNSIWLSNDHNNEAVVEGRRVRLSPGDYALLRYLYEHANTVCTRRRIAADVYETNYPSEMTDQKVNQAEKTRLEAAINRVRQAIEPVPGSPKYIITIRSKGYRLDKPDEAI